MCAVIIIILRPSLFTCTAQIHHIDLCTAYPKIEYCMHTITVKNVFYDKTSVLNGLWHLEIILQKYILYSSVVYSSCVLSSRMVSDLAQAMRFASNIFFDFIMTYCVSSILQYILY